MNTQLLLEQQDKLSCYVSAGSSERVIFELSFTGIRLIIQLPWIRRPVQWGYGLIAEGRYLWVLRGMSSKNYWK